MYSTYKFEFQALPYTYDALEPYIDRLLLEINYGKLFISSAPNQDNPLKDYTEKKEHSSL